MSIRPWLFEALLSTLHLAERKSPVNSITTSIQEQAVTRRTTKENNKLRPEDRAAHDWYRFVLSFPPHLVRHYLERFGATARHRVLDPFCGTGTTLVECKKQKVASVGIEANPMACFASSVKVDWGVDSSNLLSHAEKVAGATLAQLERDGIQDEEDLPLFRKKTSISTKLRNLPPEQQKLLLKDSISPVPLHKVLVLLEALKQLEWKRLAAHEKLALAKAVVFCASNLSFGPEVGVGPVKQDAPVVASWLNEVETMAEDLRQLKAGNVAEAIVHHADARQLGPLVKPRSIDFVITSPPYPNEKDYTRTTRLESVLFGFIRDKNELRQLKKKLVRSNTRGVYQGDADDMLVATNRAIQEIARKIEARRIELGKTSGFERLYARVTKLYFGGMARHLSDLRPLLRPGAQLAYVVGDQASYLRVMIRTGQLLAEIAESLGYKVVDIELFRTRLATATKEQLREETVILKWPG